MRTGLALSLPSRRFIHVFGGRRLELGVPAGEIWPVPRCPSETASDQLARTGIEWTRVIIRLPDDGTGALPVIRHIILKDSKYSTYKLALLRVLARIAECSLGLTRSANEEYVVVPLGLVAVFWLRQFKPVLQAGLPQMPTNVGLDGLGFVKDAYRRVAHLSHLDFRVAARFTGQSALFLHQAINDVV